VPDLSPRSPRLAPGLRAVARLTVAPADLATALGSGDVPVLGTPRVVALAEEATVAAVAPYLGPADTTVGARIELDHLAPSRPGDVVVAEATLEAVEGRRLTFDVVVTDEASGHGLARGRVWRVVVERSSFGGQARLDERG